MIKLFNSIMLVFSISFIPVSLFAQNGIPSRELTTNKLMWLDFIETVKFNNKWALMGEVSERFLLYPKIQSQTMSRWTGIYEAGEGWSISLGFSAWMLGTRDSHTYELRPVQMFMFKQKFEKSKNLGINHRIGIEERWIRNVAGTELADGYNFTVRFRYRFYMEYVIAKLGKTDIPLKLFVNDEVFFQAGAEIVYNVFQQNRIYPGFILGPVKGLAFTAGYINQIGQLKSGNKYLRTHIFRIGIQHTLDLSKKEKN